MCQISGECVVFLMFSLWFLSCIDNPEKKNAHEKHAVCHMHFKNLITQKADLMTTECFNWTLFPNLAYIDHVIG